MNAVIWTKTYDEPVFSEKEILRYAGCKAADDEILSLLRSCIQEVREKLVYKVCYRILPLTVTEDLCDFGCFQLRSKNLSQNLKECESVILFAATVGVETDRLIGKYGRIAPSKALMLQAIGAERIEALCDLFCSALAKEMRLQPRPRFSPGYGDLPITAQRQVFSMLECGKRIGLFLNDSMLMSPSKSVTAFLGLCSGETKERKRSCSACNQADCAFRGAL